MPDTTSSIRDEIRDLSAQIAESKQRLAALRRQAPVEPVDDYVLRGPGGEVRLSELFAGHDHLLVVHNMGAGCSYCTPMRRSVPATASA